MVIWRIWAAASGHAMQVDKIDFHRSVMKSHVPWSQLSLFTYYYHMSLPPLKEFTAYLLNPGT